MIWILAASLVVAAAAAWTVGNFLLALGLAWVFFNLPGIREGDG